MAIWLKQSTAYTFRLGPFVDDTDGKTAENSLTIAYTDCLLSKNGGALAAKNDSTNLTGTGANAHYTCVLNTTDTGTLGGLRVFVHVSGALPVFKDFLVVPANVYNSLVAGSDYLDVEPAAIAAGAVDTIVDEVVEGTYTIRQYLRLFASALMGKVSGGGTATITFRDTGDSKNRIVATVDASGNRTAVTLTET